MKLTNQSSKVLLINTKTRIIFVYNNSRNDVNLTKFLILSRKQIFLIQYIKTISLGCIKILSLSQKIIIALNIFERVADYLIFKQLSRQVEQTLQPIVSTFITVSFILKVTHVALLLCWSFKSPLKMTISMYCIICGSNKYMDN